MAAIWCGKIIYRLFGEPLMTSTIPKLKKCCPQNSTIYTEHFRWPKKLPVEYGSFVAVYGKSKLKWASPKQKKQCVRGTKANIQFRDLIDSIKAMHCRAHSLNSIIFYEASNTSRTLSDFSKDNCFFRTIKIIAVLAGNIPRNKLFYLSVEVERIQLQLQTLIRIWHIISNLQTRIKFDIVSYRWYFRRLLFSIYRCIKQDANCSGSVRTYRKSHSKRAIHIMASWLLTENE